MTGPKIKDITGFRFGRLLVKSLKTRLPGDTLWECFCDCGNICCTRGSTLRSGKVISCGCERKKRLLKANTIHGQSGTKLYQVWHKMKQRCINPNVFQYNNYGGRGISYCHEWEHFVAFFQWANPLYKNGLTLDRIDVNGNYEPANCRFTSNKKQQNNRRNNHILLHNGESHTISEWSEITGIKRASIVSRLGYGWSIEKTLSKDIDIRCRKRLDV